MQERIFVLADPDHGKSLPVYERYYIYSEFDSRNQETFTVPLFVQTECICGWR